MTPKLWTVGKKFGGYATKFTFLPEQGLRHFSIVI